ncbi:hypothetical protein B0J17DRAFT_764402 [Rhizoctonia solani]|nr:hypothetical protein B0J17DRAFT_764402 [Rhizoctonia solani]
MSFAPSQPSLNSSIRWSRGARAGGPVPLDFPMGWGKGKVFDWYKRIRSTSIASAQLRKEYEEPFRHEFILVSLQGGGYCRLDRRGDPNLPTQTIRSNGSDAYDTIHELTNIDGMDSESECLVRLQFNGTIDLSFLLFICFHIRSDPKTQRYTLQRFNCYFFSWTIASVLARHSVIWSTPEQLSAKVQLTAMLKKRAVDPIAKHAAKRAMDCVSAVCLSTLQPRLRKVLRKHLRPTGFIPVCVLKQVVSVWMKRNMQPRMEAVMREVVGSAMTATLESTIESLLDSRSSVMRTTLSGTLWFDTVREALRKTAKSALRDAIWSLMMKTLKAANDADIAVPQPYVHVATTCPQEDSPSDPTTGLDSGFAEPLKNAPGSDSLKTRKWRVGGLLDRFLVTGATAIVDNSYDTAICSSWGMSGGLGGDAQTYEEWVTSWNPLWDTVREHARSEGQAVVQDIVLTEGPDAGRDHIWSAVWEALDAGFETSRPLVRDYMWDTFEYATETVVDVVSDVVFSALQETSQHVLHASLNRTERKGFPHWTEVTHVELQDWIKKRIQKHSDQILRVGLGSNTAIQNDIREAMGRVWELVSKHENARGIMEIGVHYKPEDTV